MLISHNKKMSLVYFDINIGGSPAGRMVFRLFDNIAPRTALNFKSLCVGDKGIGKTTGKRLSYENTIFHRVIPGFMCQGGDFSKRDGTGGESIFGGKFADEPFRVKHTKAGQLSMANAGPNTNGSQFFITFTSTPHLDGKHVVFGELVEGMNILKKIENVEVGDRDRPSFGQEVVIQACGAIGEKSAEGDTEKGRKESLEEVLEKASRDEEMARIPDKRHKKERKDKKSEKSKKSSKKHKKKSSKRSKKSKRRRSDSSDSSDSSSSSSSSSSSDDSSVASRKSTSERRPDSHPAETDLTTGSTPVEHVERAGQEVGEIIEEPEVVAQGELKLSEEARQPAAKPARVDADGTVCRGRGNIKYRDAGAARGGRGFQGGNRGRDGGSGDRRKFDRPQRRDRDGDRPARDRYVPKERSYDRDRSPESDADRRRGAPDRDRDRDTRKGAAEKDVPGKEDSVKDRMHSALSSGRDKESGNNGKRRERASSPAREDRGQDRKRARADSGGISD